MNWKNLKLSQKLAIGFGLVIIAAIAIGYIGYNSLNVVEENVSEATKIKEIEKRVLQITKSQLQYHFNQDQQLVDNVYENLGATIEMAGEVRNRVGNENDKQLIGTVISDIEKYETTFGDFVKDEKKRSNELTKLKEGSQNILNEIAALENKQKKELERNINDESLVNYLNEFFIASELQTLINDLKENELNYDLTGKEEYVEKFNQHHSEAKKKIEELQALVSNREDRAMVENVSTQLDKFKEEFDQLVATHNNLEEEMQALQAVASDAINIAEKANTRFTESMHASIVKADREIVIFIFLGILIAFILAFTITREIMRQLGGEPGEVAEIANRIARGDLTLEIDKNEKRIGVMKDMQDMVEKLKNVISSVIDGAGNIASASQQVSSTSQQLSQGSSEQASSAEEVSSSMEEMASNIQQNSDNAQQTDKISVEASQRIKEGNEATQNSVKSMNVIAEKISIINDIAFQTNILALNAAVEAARAGESGKGFAVVASEVRKLAERSSEAAREIDEKSKAGVDISQKAGNKLQEIVPEIEKTSKLVQEIAASSNEMNNGSEQVNSALQQLNQVTQQNASASEELATSAEELSGQAEQLNEVVNFFDLNGQSNGKSSTKMMEKKKKANVAHMRQENYSNTGGISSHAQDYSKNQSSGQSETKKVSSEIGNNGGYDLKMYNSKDQDDQNFESY